MPYYSILWYNGIQKPTEMDFSMRLGLLDGVNPVWDVSYEEIEEAITNQQYRWMYVVLYETKASNCFLIVQFQKTRLLYDVHEGLNRNRALVKAMQKTLAPYIGTNFGIGQFEYLMSAYKRSTLLPQRLEEILS